MILYRLAVWQEKEVLPINRLSVTQLHAMSNIIEVFFGQ